eukprot:scaffold1970_cov396-Prasinococcus_capsulatus_cf.AAC.36
MLSASLMPAGPLSCRAPAAAERRMRCTARALLPSRCSIARRAPLSPSHVHTRLRVESGRLRSGVRMGVLDGLLPGGAPERVLPGAQPELEDDTRAAAEFFVPTFFLRGKPSSVRCDSRPAGVDLQSLPRSNEARSPQSAAVVVGGRRAAAGLGCGTGSRLGAAVPWARGGALLGASQQRWRGGDRGVRWRAGGHAQHRLVHGGAFNCTATA